MIGSFGLALRNTRRNARRSIPTLAAIVLGTLAILFFFGFTHYAENGLQTSIVRESGHLQVVVPGYLDFGGGNAGRFSIDNYADVEALIRNDPEMQPYLATVTPMLDVQGVANDPAGEYSGTFRGQAWVPNDRQIMFRWDGHGMDIPPAASALREDRPNSGVIGFGLAQLLGLCPALQLKDCQSMPAATSPTQGSAVPQDLAALAEAKAALPAGPYVNLLAASPGGLPNVIRMDVLQADRQAVRDLDNMYVSMPLKLGQRLTFGPGVQKVSAVVVQLQRTEQLGIARDRLQTLLRNKGLHLDVLSFHDVSAIYDQVVSSYSQLFFFISLLMGLVTLFSVTNTMSMAVAERTVEIGTLRALGYTRGAIARIFVLEGGLLALIGTGLGTAIAVAVAEFINHSAVAWTPPGRTSPVPLHLDVLSDPALIWRTIIMLSVLACLASLLPAIRAARMDVGQALRHV